MGGLQDHRRGDSGVTGFLPARCTQAPVVAWLQAWKTPLWHWRGQVVSDRSREFEELLGDNDTDGMRALVLGSCIAATCPVEACQRVHRARNQVAAEDIPLILILNVLDHGSQDSPIEEVVAAPLVERGGWAGYSPHDSLSRK